MKQRSILGIALVAMVGLLHSCADPYSSGHYGRGDYPRNFAEAAVPIVVGAAVIGALTSNSRERARNRYCEIDQFDERNWGAAYR
jgi:hypothetical protein